MKPTNHSNMFVVQHNARLLGNNCAKCNKALIVGDEVLSKIGRRKHKYYHKNCWESLFN